MAPTPIRRSSWQDSSSSNSLPLTLLSNGPRDAREHPSAQWKSGRWRLKPCGEGSQGEWKQSRIYAPDHRACGPVRIFLIASIHPVNRSEEHTSELQSRLHLVCRLLLEKKHELDTAH